MKGICAKSIDFRNMNSEKLSPADRFWRKVDRHGPDECWPWLGARDGHGKGYGIVRIAKRTHAASRAAWILMHGDLPKGIVVCHCCDNSSCCNPAHLFLGTMADNQADMAKKGRAARPHARLTKEQVLTIKAQLAAGAQQKALARMYGVHRVTIHDIAAGRTWVGVA